MSASAKVQCFCLLAFLFLCCGKTQQAPQLLQEEGKEVFKYQTEKFTDVRILRYRVPGFEQLAPRQKELVYYLYQAALSGRDILWDQNYKHNLCIRRTLENIVRTYKGDRQSENFGKFVVYTKLVWYSNGIHHEYSTLKIKPGFPPAYFAELAENSDSAGFPLQGNESVSGLVARLTPVIFDPKLDAKRVNLDPNADLIKDSANNFYQGVTKEEAEAYYKKIIDPKDPRPVSYGLNSKMVKENGRIKELVWKVGGMYSPAIERIVYWLEKALDVAENENQKAALAELVDYYRSGDLKDFDKYNILWVADTLSFIDCINGFIEVYGDAMGYRATFEAMVYFKDLEATRRTQAIAGAAQWFEDHSTIAEAHKRAQVKGVSAKVITAVAGSGAVRPASPIGINLPNANWIRVEYGSKSVTLGNIVHSYAEVQKTSGLLEEFLCRSQDIELAKKYGDLADLLQVDLHEVIGHASGRLEKGVATPKETLKNYASTLEEARADLVALYFIPDAKMIEIGVMPSLDVARVSYDDYITNGLMVQLARIDPGENLEEAHMRNRQLIAAWAYEKGLPDKVVEKVERDGKTFFVINDYGKLRELFGKLLREVQRIISQGDYQAGKNLVESYGVKVDQKLHGEVLERYRKLGIARYSGFLNPLLIPVVEGGRIVDVRIEYPEDFTAQMLLYGKEYSFLPTYN